MGPRGYRLAESSRESHFVSAPPTGLMSKCKRCPLRRKEITPGAFQPAARAVQPNGLIRCGPQNWPPAKLQSFPGFKPPSRNQPMAVRFSIPRPFSLLSTFEGYAIRGKLNVSADVPAAACAPGGPSPAEVAALASFCRGNLAALLQGATPSFYLPGGYDGGVNGAVLSVQIPGRSSPLEVSKMSFRPEIPLQATLMG